MSPLFMETGCELDSPGSVSEESNSVGSDREEGTHIGRRGRGRQEKNRNAARKSRRKQTERADELHEELQCLERSNSAIKKEIAALKKDFHLYTTALERHEPLCCLKDSASSLTSRLSVSSSAGRRSNSSPPGDPSGASRSAFPAAPLLSISLTSSLALQTRDCVESGHLSSLPPPAPTTLDLPQLFTSSSSVTAPDSVSFSAVPTPCALFSGDSPSLIASRPTNVPPVCTGLVSHSAPSRSGAVHGSSSTSASAHFSPLHPGSLNEFLMTQASFLPASSNVVPFNSHLAAENAGLDCPMSLPCSLLSPTLSPQSLSMSYPTPAFDLEPSYTPQVTLHRSSLLSTLTVPSPLNESHTTYSGFGEPVPQPPASLPLLGDASRDLSLSEFLEHNDWILSGSQQ